MSRHWVHSRTGRQLLALGLLAFSVVALVIGFLRWNPFANNSTVRAVFSNAIGVTRSGLTTPVRIAGVQVGTVSAISRVGQNALFTMKLDPAAARALHADASAELRPRTPFEGTAFIDLHTGSATAPALAGTIPVSRTSNYVGLYSALSFANAPTRARIQRVVHEFGATLRPSAQQGLQGALATLPALTARLGPAAAALAGPSSTELTGTIRGAARTFSSVSQSEQSVVPFLRSAAQTFAALNTDGGRPLDASIRALPGTLASLETGRRALASILDRSDPLTQQLRPGLRALPGTLSAVDPLLRHGQPALSRAAPLVHQLRSALSVAASATPATRKLLSGTQPSFDVLNQSLIGALLRPTPVGLPAYLAVINTLQGGNGAFQNFQTPEQAAQPGQMGAGHFVNFEGRFYTGYATPDLPPCALFSALMPNLSTQLGQSGVCTP